MSEEQDNSANKGMGFGGRLLFIVLILLFVYAIHFGPLLFLVNIFEVPSGGNFEKVLFTIDYPHLYAAYYSETYFDYVNWCAGGDSRSAWQDFKDYLDGRSNP